MTHAFTTAILGSLFLAGSAAVCAEMLGDDLPADVARITLHSTKQNVPPSLPQPPGGRYLLNVVKDSNETHKADVTRIGTRSGGEATGGKLYECSIHYRKLAKGHIIPIFGCIYRVNSVDSFGEDGSLTFVRLKATQLPRGLTERVDAFAIPLKASLHIDGAGLIVEEIRDAEKAKNQLRSRIVISERGRPQRTINVQESELLRFGNYTYKVLRIVQPNDSIGLMGWVEFIHAIPE